MSTSERLLAGRCALITGASRGLGLEIARHYLEAGASVAICARHEASLQSASERLLKNLGPGQSLLVTRADVSVACEVKQFVDGAVERFGRIDILVHNAGVIGPIGSIETVDPTAFMRAVEINLLSSLLLSQAALPHLKRAARGKVIQLSGGGATNPLPNLSAYAASKAAVVRFVETLAEETRAHGIDVNALAPGLLDTRMLDEMLGAGPQSIGADMHRRLTQEKQSGATPLAKGAKLAVFLGSSLSDGITGKLISAAWDPWSRFPELRAELDGSDIYTLRRVVPRDRGKDWGDVH